MLSELHVEHLGVIDTLDLVLGPGLTVVTGETGAGKTLIVDAVGLLVGGRAASELVRSDALEARVDGRFVAGDHETVLTRVQPRVGRSRAYVDGRQATAAQLSARGEGWVELHGQHQHHGLARRSVQREALDRFGGVDTAHLQDARAHLTALEAELASLGGDARTRARELDLLRHQIDEIERAGLNDPDEERQLEAEQDLLSDAAEHRRAGESAWNTLRGDDGVADVVSGVIRLLEGRRPWRAHGERLRAVAAELDDVADDLRHRLDEIDENPERLAEVLRRRQLIRDLRRRYGDTVGEVLAFAQNAQQRHTELAGFEERSRRLEFERGEALDLVERQARQVGEARRAAAPALSQALTQQVRRLALPHATVTVTVGDAHADPAGDMVSWWFTANPGLEPLPLARVASGGEMSRVMLALRLVLGGGPDTLIFDEVDAGIGGEAATAVADALAEVARDRQVLVVTHLAQVAARAQHHLVATKQVLDGRTVTSVTPVHGEARIAEIARMLSGRPEGERARRHAEELLAMAQGLGIDHPPGSPG